MPQNQSMFARFTRPQLPSALSRLWPLLLGMGVYSAAVYGADQWLLQDSMDLHASPHALLGTILGILLVFRTNTAYDRWWEGRKLWGQLVNDTRNFCIKVRAQPRITRAEALHCGRLLINFARALKEHLREGVRSRQLSLYQKMPMDAEPEHVPAHIALQVRQQLTRWRQQEAIDGFDALLLDPHARALMDICGSCERIRRTPLSISYRTFIRRVLLLYLATLPWGLVDQLHFWTIPAVVIVSYFMLGLEWIAEDVEEPFGRSEDDLLLDDICRGIETSVHEIISGGESKAPAMPFKEALRE